ncbi:MAG: DUF3575 domain-containing protein [Muribaculaceae bacterium]|nr:DUF3575 domain-containing protein [Muribaculaceae bacterium]
MKRRYYIRHIIAILLILTFTAPLYSQEKNDSVFSFRFITGKNMFYVPYIDNGDQFTKMLDLVGMYKESILNHKGCVHVNGYCSARPTEAQNLAIAKIRSNRVKSELIVRKGLTEDCFTTRNHSGQGNFVTVNIVIPKDSIKEETRYEPEIVTPEEVVTPENDITAEKTVIEDTTSPVEQTDNEEQVIDEPEAGPEVNKVDHFALKTNLLGYAVLMPNIELEWMFTHRWSVALEWQGAWYAKNEPHKVYRLSTIIPEVRFWAIERKKWHGMYVGLFVGGGLYDLCNGENGHEGEGGMGGVSVGYMWPISKHLSLDAGLGVGYMRIRDKNYTPEDGHFLYQYTKNINYFGPLRLKLSLAWRF